MHYVSSNKIDCNLSTNKIKYLQHANIVMFLYLAIEETFLAYLSHKPGANAPLLQYTCKGYNRCNYNVTHVLMEGI